MFKEFNKEIFISNKGLDININKINATLDCIMFEHALEIENLEVMFLKESATDVMSYIKEAKETLNTKFNDIIKSTIIIIEKFFSDLIDKVKTMFVKKEIEDSIDKLREKAKHHEIATLKIEIPDFNNEARVIYDYKNHLKKIFIDTTNLASKVASAKDTDDINELNKEWDSIKERLVDEKELFLKKHNAVKNNEVTVTVDTAVKLLAHNYRANVMDATLSKMKSNSVKDISSMNNINDMNVKIMKRCLNMQVEISKIEGNLLVNSLTRLITAIFKGIDDYHDDY